jgi:hypothetical protein
MVGVIRSPAERILGLPGAKISFEKTNFQFQNTGGIEGLTPIAMEIGAARLTRAARTYASSILMASTRLFLMRRKDSARVAISS